MRYAFIIGLFSLSLGGCAFEKTYGVPHNVWKQLSPDQKQSLIDYDQKRQAQKQKWIWKNAEGQPKAAAPAKSQS